VAKTSDISLKITMTPDLRKRWVAFIHARGYARGPYLRTLIEAVTDPVKWPEIERILRRKAEETA
jgi:hypothetical protein